MRSSGKIFFTSTSSLPLFLFSMLYFYCIRDLFVHCNFFLYKFCISFSLLFCTALFSIFNFYFSDHLPVDCFSKNMSKKEPLSENRTKLWSSFYWGREIQYEWFHIFSLLIYNFEKNLVNFRFFFSFPCPPFFCCCFNPFPWIKKNLFLLHQI